MFSVVPGYADLFQNKAEFLFRKKLRQLSLFAGAYRFQKNCPYLVKTFFFKIIHEAIVSVGRKEFGSLARLFRRSKDYLWLADAEFPVQCIVEEAGDYRKFLQGKSLFIKNNGAVAGGVPVQPENFLYKFF